jgi:hypothetical protein
MASEAQLLYEVAFEGKNPAKFLTAARKSISKVQDDPIKSRVLLGAFLRWLDDNPVRFSPDSPMGRLTELILRFDEDDELDDEDLLNFITIIKLFFKSVTAKDIASVENWENTTNLSPNLLALFGKPRSEAKSTASLGSWRAPEKYGLDNSERILPAKSQFKAESKDEYEDEKEVDVADAKTMSRDDSEYDDDDDDDDEDYEDDDDARSESDVLRLENMSVNLMRALGLDTTGMEVETDWKPPSVTGIDANPDSYKGLG